MSDIQSIFKRIELMESCPSEPNIYTNIFNIKSPIDFGKSGYRDFDIILQLFDSNLISVEYCDPHILSEYNKNSFLTAQERKPGSDEYSHIIKSYKQILQYGITKNNNNIIGYLPWQLFKSDILIEGRDETYVHRQESKLQDVINIIKKINTQPTEQEKIRTFKEFFPKSRLLNDKQDSREFMPFNL
jgi:hypothetical protein